MSDDESVMIDVIVEVRGGLIAEVYCDHPQVRAVVVDWDELESPERCGRVGFVWSPLAPTDALPSDTRQQYAMAVTGVGKRQNG